MAELRQQLESANLRIGAVILAGGLARRMGGLDKGLVMLGNKSMTAWVLEAVRSEVHNVIVNANRNADAYAALGVEVVPDRHSGHVGPLAGLSVAMHTLDTDYVFMCPCDSPFISAGLIGRLGSAAMSADADIAVAHDGHRMQPVFCVAHRRVLPSLDDYLDSGERKIDRWYATRTMTEVDCIDFASSFRNINTEEERVDAEQELMR